MFFRGIACLSGQEVVRILGDIENALSEKAPLHAIIEKLMKLRSVDHVDPLNAIHAAFIAARVHKIAGSKKQVSEATRAIVEDAVFRVDVNTIPIGETSKLFWACAMTHVKPLLPEGFPTDAQLKSLNDKDLCNLIWALSKFVSNADPDFVNALERIVDTINDETCNRLSNEDVTALLRSISNAYRR
jgi:hypothetical protein